MLSTPSRPDPPGPLVPDSEAALTARDRWVGIAAIEGIAVAIGLAMPITPSRTGSDGSLAQLFLDDPTYLQEFVVYFLLTHALFILIGLVAWVWSRFGTIAEPD
jgi:hypothetical protein